MGRNTINPIIENQICTKCNINKIVRQTATGEKRLYYYGGKNKKCNHVFTHNPNSTTTQPMIETKIVTQPVIQTVPNQIQTIIVTQNTQNVNQSVVEDHKYYPRKIGDKTDVEILQFLCNKRKSALLVGDAGSGKNHSLRHLARINKLAYYPFSCNGGTTPDQLLGHYVPTPDGHFIWQDGALTQYVKHGGLFVVDEINSANAEMLFVLHQLLDDHKQIQLGDKDGTIIKVHPNFWLCATMNPDYDGTKPLNEALKDRFVVLEYEYSVNAESALIEDKLLVSFAKKLRAMYRQNQIRTPFGTRRLLEFQDIKKALGEKVAVETMLNRFELADRQAVREVYEITVQNARKTADTQKEEGDTK